MTNKKIATRTAAASKRAKPIRVGVIGVGRGNVSDMRSISLQVATGFIALSLATATHAVTLERIVSREDPKLD
ncbi:MAG: hypothetical protein WCR06_10530, partial [bacterium]